MSIRSESRVAADKLLDYLTSEYDANGISRTAPDNIQFYYKLPAIFAYGGRRELAYRTLEQFVGRFMKNRRLTSPQTLRPTPGLHTSAGGHAGWRSSGNRQFARTCTAVPDSASPYARTYCPRSSATTRLRRPGAATPSSCAVDARLVRCPVCTGTGGLSVSRPSLMNTTRRSVT
jgi:hypothetical protein